MFRSRFVSLCAVLTVLLVSTLLRAQQTAVSPRIVAPIDESRLVTFPGGVPLLARAQFDEGRASASTQMTFVRLVLSRSAQQEAALDKFMGEQLDPSSANYHKWLTPQQFASLYGPADSDIDTLVIWLQSHGFTVQPVAPGHTSIAFSGSVSQIEAAFHTEVHSFNANGVPFFSNVSSPSIPAALAPVVSGIGQLNTIKPRPHHILGNTGKYDAQQKRLVHADTSSRPSPFLTIGSASTGYSLYVVPGDAATIYNSPNSYNAGFSSGTSYTGTSVTIGIGGDATIQGSTVANYREAFLAGNTTQPTITNVSSDPATCTIASDPNNCDQDEAYLDNEIAGGLAPGATIHFYTSANLSLAIEQAINDNTVDIFSLSFGECEAGLTTGDNAIINSWWQQAAAQGIAVTVSSGDNGSAGCDNDNTEFAAQYGLQVSGYASTPYNIAVGGTDYIGLVSSFSTYASTSQSTSSTNFRSALSYIPEATWNDSTTTDTTISVNVPAINTMTGKTNIVAGSGGASSCSTNTNVGSLSGCTSGYAKPSWQRGNGVPTDKVRDLPDVSLLAGNGADDTAWLVCTDDTIPSSTITGTTNCTTQSDGSFYFYGYGGTSTSAPAFAGILALVQQKTGGRLGQAAQNLYDLYNGANASSIFHDITVGNNSVICTAGTPNCSKNTAGNYFLTGYNTTAGYDLATGLGSVNVTNLINNWNSAIGVSIATVSVTPSAPAITTIQPLTVTGAVSGSAGTPTGSVTLTSGTYTSSAATLDGSGDYSISVPAGSLKAGSDTLTVNYSGDSVYSTGTGTASVTVTASTFSVSGSAPTSVTAGSGSSSTITVTGSNNYSGSVSLTCALTTSPAGAVDSPSCSVTGSPITLSSSTTSATATVNFSTTASSAVPGHIASSHTGKSGWAKAGAATVLAFFVFLGIPARRRAWRAIAGVLLLITALGTLSACGSTSGSGGGGGTSNPGTTAGNYTFTITGTGTPAVSPAPTTTVTLTVN